MWGGPDETWTDLWCEAVAIEIVDSIGPVATWPPELGGLFPQWEESRTPLLASDVPALVDFLWCNGIEPDTIMGL